MATVNTDSRINDLMSTMNPKPAATDSVDADTNKFMTLLVTQLKNQDPLNPLDNAQVTSQLAQLSTVTGVNKLNATLESLKASYQSAESMQAVNLIGHGVLVEGNYAQLHEGKAVLGVELDSPADSVQVIITDKRTGKEVQTVNMGSAEAGVIPLVWDGVPDPNNLDEDGKPVTLPDGAYTFRVVATRGDQTLSDARGLAFDSVASVTTSGKDGTRLNLLVNGMMKMPAIKQVL
jgi:flagellar basal-body rod modification protein FlgD